jgi:lipopolysaccharide biosynthesis protein
LHAGIEKRVTIIHQFNSVTQQPQIAVLYHIFYEDTVQSVCRELEPLLPYQPVFYFNICSDTPGRAAICEALLHCFPMAYIINSSNKGKDIGGKLTLLQLLLEAGIEPDYLLLLHDKKSLQALKSRTWKNDLLKIIEPVNIGRILQLFTTDEKCGIAATAEYLLLEPFVDGAFANINGPYISSLLQTYTINPGDYRFVAGTMFWVRAQPLLQFFKLHSPAAIRAQLENGNVIDNFSGTVTHSWERLLSWIVTGKGYYMHGI